MTTDELTTDHPTRSTDWAEAFHNYQREEAAYALAAAEYDDANRAVDNDCPDRRDEFRAYGLSFERDRARALIIVDRYIEQRDHADRGKGEELPDEVIERDVSEAEAIVDDFLDHLAERDAAYERHFVGIEKKHDDACSKRWDARNKLLTTAAPNAEAMLVKLDLLADIMTEGDDQDAPAVQSIRDDAHRLLGRA